MKSNSSLLFAIFIGVALVGCVSTQAMKRLEVDFGYVDQIAKKLAEDPFESLSDEVPESLKVLDYDDYRRIRFIEDMTLWRKEGMPFQAQFFHLGYLFEEPVELNEFTETHMQRVPYVNEFFDTSDLSSIQGDLSSSLDYAGVKILYALHSDLKRYDEVVSFLGASYFRALGKDMHYGLSARGLAVDTGLSRAEEFPRFTRFWLGKPLGNSESMTIYALLDSKSVTGAYQFTIVPGETTRVDVKCSLYMREAVESLGIAPLTSMFWFGENSAIKPSDYRPEVHDSDGLLIESSNGQQIWRPLDVGPQSRHAYYEQTQLNGFGLLQRDRAFDSYEDLEAEYHKRPSVWVEPKGDWGKGHVRLLELPTDSEFDDNVVAFWESEKTPKQGENLIYEYSLHWTKQRTPSGKSVPYATSSRAGYADENQRDILYIVDFAAGDEYTFSPENRPKVDARASSGASLVFADVAWNAEAGAWRLTLRVHAEGGSSAPVELSCQLNFGDGVSSELWNYQWTR
ncbi:glucan biosynthesis protein G [Puniceicoccaceae bacterium K14]|nr:glucan biosynthesis protein G [Puniceicoccaceae bacterium K14]